MSSTNPIEALRLEYRALSAQPSEGEMDSLRSRMEAAGLIGRQDDSTDEELVSLGDELGLAADQWTGADDKRVAVAATARRLAVAVAGGIGGSEPPDWYGVAALVRERTEDIEDYATDTDSDVTEWFDDHYMAETRRQARVYGDNFLSY